MVYEPDPNFGVLRVYQFADTVLKYTSDFLFEEAAKRAILNKAWEDRHVVYATSFRYHREQDSQRGHVFQAEAIARAARDGENFGTLDHSEEWVAEYLLQSGQVEPVDPEDE